MADSFVEDIKKWVEYDNKIDAYNSKIKSLKDEKISLSNKITIHMENNQMNNTIINITGGKIKLVEQSVSVPLTYKFLEENLNQYFNDSSKTKDIIDFLKQNRNVKKNKFLKRYTDKNNNDDDQ